VASSADGGKLIAAVDGGGIYTWETTRAPLLTVATASGKVVISWTIPSMDFELQQNSDLSTTNWTDITVTPTVTNVQNQVTMPLPVGGNRFYRLKNF
jgi:hypothetical protein